MKIKTKEWLALSEAERFMKIYQAFVKKHKGDLRNLKPDKIKNANEQLKNVENQDCIKMIMKDKRLKDIDEYIKELTSDFIGNFGFEPSKFFLAAEGDSLSIRMFLN
ncbi:hypothetical protein [Bacillus sp. NSP9.1]|uniref:hypothetical protein n=1 Tax=Bacillus sp. NSP9.1 TaxID=1071078 RepID=UPI0004015B16|nr:hypothetical protein [Bacillus sp. NSP9.1]